MWLEHVHAMYLHLNLSVLHIRDLNVRLAENHKKVSFAGVLQIAGHVQVGIHASLENGDAAQFGKVCGVRVVVEGATD